jgi:hypothetical protein
VHAFADVAAQMRDTGDFSGLRGSKRIVEWLG